MPSPAALENKKFGKLLVIKKAGLNKHGNVIWLCKCDCGKNCKTTSHNLLSGNTKSCGCLAFNYFHNHDGKNIKHNKSNTRLYHIWRDMKLRCYNEKQVGYKNYGARGIKVCNDWKNDFKAFYAWAINNGYNETLSIDRINNDGDYEPSNCRWNTCVHQSNHKRNNIFLTYAGKTQTIAQWSNTTGLLYSTIYGRFKRGCKIDIIFNRKGGRLKK